MKIYQSQNIVRHADKILSLAGKEQTIKKSLHHKPRARKANCITPSTFSSHFTILQSSSCEQLTFWETERYISIFSIIDNAHATHTFLIYFNFSKITRITENKESSFHEIVDFDSPYSSFYYYSVFLFFLFLLFIAQRNHNYVSLKQ